MPDYCYTEMVNKVMSAMWAWLVLCSSDCTLAIDQ